jgi:hypothetical protein
MAPSDRFRSDDEQEAFEALAMLLNLLIRLHLAETDGNADPWRQSFSMEAEEIANFVRSQSRADLYQTLRANSAISDKYVSDAVALLRPGSTVGDRALEALQLQPNEGTDEPSEAELHALLLVFGELVDGPSPPSTLDSETVDLVTDRNPSVHRLPSWINTWLDGTEPTMFSSLWPFSPSLSWRYCEPLFEASTTTEWIRGTGTADATGLTGMESDWFGSMAESEGLRSERQTGS